MLFLKPPSGPNSCLWVEAKSLERCSVFLWSQTFPQASESLFGVRSTEGDLEASWLWCCQEAVTKVWLTVSRPSIHLAPARPQGTDSGERAVTAARAARLDQVKDGEAWCAAVHGVAKSQIRPSDRTTAMNPPSPAPFQPPQDSLPQHPWLGTWRSCSYPSRAGEVTVCYPPRFWRIFIFMQSWRIISMRNLS